ncbi:ras-related protein Rab-28-like [Athalia rosae]|uniref:ras-related protein Rab-28-like n=1 Tax=Athalia rosae TaxID=37344 RepID=UPI002033339A|nr:ras-related protein Rab-28-like [Athalia rosae]
MSDSEEELFEKRIKIVFVGDSGAGKTSIATRYCNGEFTRHYSPTAGVDFFLKSVRLGDSKNVTLYIWDIGGLALHGNMLDKYIFGAHVIFFVYDVTNMSSFEILETWIETIRHLNEILDMQPAMAILGNKCDIAHQRTVKSDKSHKFAIDNGMPCYDVSARTGESIGARIGDLVAQIFGIPTTKIGERGLQRSTGQDSIDRKQSKPTLQQSTLPMVQKITQKQAKKLKKTASNPMLPRSKSSVCSLQ